MPRAPARQNLSTDADDDRLTNTLLTLNVLYQTHVHPHLPEPLQPVSNTISSILVSSAPYLSHFIGLFRSIFAQATAAQDGSGLLSLGVLLITLYMALRIMNYIRRTIMGWVWLGIKMILVLFAIQIGMYINSYGWERALKDAGWAGGIAWGMLEDVLDNNQSQRQPRGTRRRGQNTNQYAVPRGRYY